MNIVIACCVGMSSSMMMESMLQYCKKTNQQMDIQVLSVDLLCTSDLTPDVILLGPQVRMSKKRLSKVFCDTPIGIIPDGVYAHVDGKKAVAFAEKLYAEKMVGDK